MTPGAHVTVPTDELPRRVPQDPEAVRAEQEVRRLAAERRPVRRDESSELLEAIHTGRIPVIESDCHGFGPPEEGGGILDIDPSNKARDAQIAVLANRIAELEKRVRALTRKLAAAEKRMLV